MHRRRRADGLRAALMALSSTAAQLLLNFPSRLLDVVFAIEDLLAQRCVRLLSARGHRDILARGGQMSSFFGFPPPNLKSSSSLRRYPHRQKFTGFSSSLSSPWDFLLPSLTRVLNLSTLTFRKFWAAGVHRKVLMVETVRKKRRQPIVMSDILLATAASK